MYLKQSIRDITVSFGIIEVIQMYMYEGQTTLMKLKRLAVH